ncbi:hypothetical protein [Kribbella sp. HUAS MG21]|uniref:Uncharacterized protein n=1 Tax=Kribbella sp. HUAS MG21 TaxID=3160966 RepID=A0AAU7TH66_9ACTN
MTQEPERRTREPDDRAEQVSDDSITVNEPEDGVRRTADDEPVHPRSAGETDPAAAADPTIPPDSPHGQPTD